MTDTPEVHSTTTSATPIADSIPAPETGAVDVQADDHADHVDWEPDIAALSAAKGDPAVWGQQFTELVGHTTGSWIQADVFTDWLQLYSQQVAQVVNRAALFQVANTALPSEVTGDPGLALLAFRDQLGQAFRKAAGL